MVAAVVPSNSKNVILNDALTSDTFGYWNPEDDVVEEGNGSSVLDFDKEEEEDIMDMVENVGQLILYYAISATHHFLICNA